MYLPTVLPPKKVMSVNLPAEKFLHSEDVLRDSYFVLHLCILSGGVDELAKVCLKLLQLHNFSNDFYIKCVISRTNI